MADHRLTDDELDAILDGSSRGSAATSPVAAYLAELRGDAAATPPVPSDALASVLEEGLTAADAAPQGILTFSSKPAQEGILTASTDRGILTRGILTASTDRGILTRGILTIRTRGRTLARVLVTKFAALGLLSKAAVAGATVTVAASGAGVAGVLPPPVQVAFDDTVGRQVATEDEGTGDDGALDVQDRATGVDGRTVADDATDDEPGVDGREVAEEASNGRAGGDAADTASVHGRTTAEERSAGRAGGGELPDQATSRPEQPTRPEQPSTRQQPTATERPSPDVQGKPGPEQSSQD